MKTIKSVNVGSGAGCNEVMKTLTIITTIFIPITFVTGFFGMNFFEACRQTGGLDELNRLYCDLVCSCSQSPSACTSG